MCLMYLAVSNFLGAAKTNKPAPSRQDGVDPWQLPPTHALPEWPLGSVIDMHVYLSTSPNGNLSTEWASTYRESRDKELPQFVWKNITYGDYTDTRVINFDVNFPDVRLFFSCFKGSIFLKHSLLHRLCWGTVLCGQIYFSLKMVHTLTHKILPSILPLYTMFGSVCLFAFYFHTQSPWLSI